MSNHLDQLERLDRLKISGALTDAEFEAQKAAVLAGPKSASRRGWLAAAIVVGAIIVIASLGLFAATFVVPKPNDIAKVKPQSVPTSNGIKTNAPTPTSSTSNRWSVDQLDGTGFNPTEICRTAPDDDHPTVGEISPILDFDTSADVDLSTENIPLASLRTAGLSPSHPNGKFTARIEFDGASSKSATTRFDSDPQNSDTASIDVFLSKPLLLASTPKRLSVLAPNGSLIASFDLSGLWQQFPKLKTCLANLGRDGPRDGGE